MYKETNKKIDIFVNGIYKCSTNWSKTCKEAKEKFLEKNPELKNEKVEAYFSKDC